MSNLRAFPMIHQPNKRSFVTEIICYLYVTLFIYAAASKIIDFESFRIQLGQSPLLSAFAETISWLVPTVEIIIALMLLFPKLRFAGLFFSFSLMVMFTVYIIIILNWTSYTPCSCGGILEKMGWTEHLIFNLFFIVLALTALVLIRRTDTQSHYKPDSNFYSFYSFKIFVLVLLITTIASTMLIVFLYGISENKMHRNNAFIRRYPPHPATLINGKYLKYNSYYIAGMSKGKIYLGNSTAPLHALEIDTTLKGSTTLNLRLNELKKNKYTSLQFRVMDSVFFLTDPTVPAIFTGRVDQWLADEAGSETIPFSAIEPTGATSVAFKTAADKTGEDILAIARLGEDTAILKNPALLTKQIDGIFDTDGLLCYNKALKKIVYVYFYRNEYIVIGNAAELVAKGRTIDTIQKAVITLVDNRSKKQRTLASPPLTVNQFAATAGNYLYIKSNRLGRFEPEQMPGQASIIDVYNLSDQSYVFSFYLYDYEGEKIKTFIVEGNLLIGITEHYLVTYRLQKHAF